MPVLAFFVQESKPHLFCKDLMRNLGGVEEGEKTCAAGTLSAVSSARGIRQVCFDNNNRVLALRRFVFHAS